MKNIFLVLISIVLLASACKESNPTIDNSDNSFKALIATGDNLNQVSLINEPSGSIEKNNILDNLPDSLTVSKPITFIAANGSNIYVFIPDEYKILVMDRWNYSFKNAILFKEQKLQPIDIDFSNSTDAYIVFKDYNKICLFDTKFMKSAKFIDVGESPISVAYYDKKIMVVNNKSNTLSVINTQNYTKEKDIPLSASPLKIYISTNASVAGIICGKAPNVDSSGGNIPPANLQILDLQNMNIKSTYELRTLKVSSSNIYPVGAAVSDNSLMYIATQQGIFKSNLRLNSTPVQSIKTGVNQIGANALRNQFLIIYKDNTSNLINPATGLKIIDLNLPPRIGTLLII